MVTFLIQFSIPTVPLSLYFALFLFLTFFPLPLSWLCELVRVSVLFSTLFSPSLSLSLLLVVSDRACSSHTALWNKTDTINKGTHLSACTPELSVKCLENRALQLCDVLEIIKVPYEHRYQPDTSILISMESLKILQFHPMLIT